MKQDLLSNNEIKELELWLQTKSDIIPEKIRILIFKIIGLYKTLIKLIETNKSLADRLKEFMGIKPKSEKGSQLNH